MDFQQHLELDASGSQAVTRTLDSGMWESVYQCGRCGGPREAGTLSKARIGDR